MRELDIFNRRRMIWLIPSFQRHDTAEVPKHIVLLGRHLLLYQQEMKRIYDCPMLRKEHDAIGGSCLLLQFAGRRRSMV